jgi:hypothetical protein
VFFNDDGSQYLYYSRNAYRSWNWDSDLGKYVEESNILAVPLTRAWWEDPAGRTMPSIDPAYRGANASKGGPDGPRRDGWVQILSYQQDKQSWENAHVNDYELSGGERKDRRWEEGSTTFRSGGRYYLTYSANNWESPSYGVGYATATNPLGPWKKAPENPILSQDPQIGMYSTGHGSLAFSPDGSEMYYVHHGRPTTTAGQRRLYTEGMTLEGGMLDIDQATSDRPVPSGVAPYAIQASTRSLRLRRGESAPLTWRVDSAAGSSLALANPLNRVQMSVANPRVATLDLAPDGASGTVAAGSPGRTTITLAYQRALAAGGWADVFNLFGTERQPVTVTLDVTVTG